MKEPITATHKNLNTGEFLRIGKSQYAECFIDGRFWTECATLKNSDLPKQRTLSDCEKYMRIFKTGLARDLCNIRLLFIGSSYRVK